MKRAVYLLSVLVVAVIMAAHAWGETVPPANSAPAKEAPLQTAPVMLGRSPIFSVPGYHALTAEERAARIGERITKIADDLAIRTDTLKTDDSDISTEIVAGERVIMSVFDSDSRPFGMTRQVLAAECAKKIGAAIDQYRTERTPKNITHGALLSLIATVVLMILVVLVRVLFRRLQAVVEAWKAGSIQFQKFEILRLEQVKALFVGVIRGLRLLVVLVLLYLYVHFILSFFPWTRPFSGQILHYLLVPLKTMEWGIIGYIPNLIFLVVLAFVTRYVIKFMRLISAEVEKGNITFPGFYPEWAKPTFKIARFLFIAFVAVVAFPYFPGSQSPAFKGITIF
ncbi:MAG TPA: hypothetical protein VK187_10585, partial [Geobacteraceae bacterium]|nr:hypothetical protein [Geobacteraceae bacterium]